MAAIRVLIAEDQTLMRQGLKTILDLEDGFEVVGEAADGEQAIERALALRPDMVLMDVQMPLLSGVAATAQVTGRLPATRVIILTTFDYDEYVFEGIKAGASGYLLKDTPASDLLHAIRRVHAGESMIEPTVAARLIMEFGRRHPGGSRPAAQRSGEPGAPWASPAYEPLSEREREVLRLIAEGLSNKVVAARLVLAEGTVKNHVAAILEKLHAANRTQAAHIAQQHGLL